MIFYPLSAVCCSRRRSMSFSWCVSWRMSLTGQRISSQPNKNHKSEKKKKEEGTNPTQSGSQFHTTTQTTIYNQQINMSKVRRTRERVAHASIERTNCFVTRWNRPSLSDALFRTPRHSLTQPNTPSVEHIIKRYKLHCMCMV